MKKVMKNHRENNTIAELIKVIYSLLTLQKTNDLLI